MLAGAFAWASGGGWVCDGASAMHVDVLGIVAGSLHGQCRSRRSPDGCVGIADDPYVVIGDYWPGINPTIKWSAGAMVCVWRDDPQRNLAGAGQFCRQWLGRACMVGVSRKWGALLRDVLVTSTRQGLLWQALLRCAGLADQRAELSLIKQCHLDVC